jgi:hypothetical protein
LCRAFRWRVSSDSTDEPNWVIWNNWFVGQMGWPWWIASMLFVVSVLLNEQSRGFEIDGATNDILIDSFLTRFYCDLLLQWVLRLTMIVRIPFSRHFKDFTRTMSY